MVCSGDETPDRQPAFYQSWFEQGQREGLGDGKNRPGGVPFVFEFLGLPEGGSTESDLEQAIINNLQYFLLEMGRGFCFVARQKRITFNTKHYYIDLLLYHRKLKSLIAVDLKIGEKEMRLKLAGE